MYIGQALSSIAFIFTALQFEAHRKAAIPESKAAPLNKTRLNKTTTSSAGRVSALHAARAIVCLGGSTAILYFVLLFCLSMGTCLVENLLFLYFVNDLHASNALCGLTVVVTAVLEVPLFAAAPTLLRVVGPAGLMLVGASA